MLKATNKARFALLQAANATLPAADRFAFYLATCKCTAEYGYIGGQNVEWELEDGPYYRITEYKRIALIAVLNAENIAFVGNYVGKKAAAELFAASLERLDLTDDTEWVLHALQAISAAESTSISARSS
ncbi:hypothetical protein AMAG_19078 [Allomyces macrogynus ATCC 38327]|uniref:Uncharacterized protein n=1 Tax=Allomyces macrogynus (strain ATCC 38327) TaxID=578462 RepID=A0A0L0SN87_ALLM3|nr:hypothetical protein AMAG_19078 [Allomyces macrogynus ATCC 38327]|eukprot:KNE63849.1 hypothetical protein AMAG_19078 [Allomyces macrogynus ATCC 38327]